jgi:quercetin dioxygenase-like cupin family protein
MEPIALGALVTAQLGRAREAAGGRSARTVHGGRGSVLRQTLLALTAGNRLADHDAPGEATLQVLHGRVRLGTSTGAQEGTAGDLLVVPPQRHDLLAVVDSAVLLTVAVPAAADPVPSERHPDGG